MVQRQSVVMRALADTRAEAVGFYRLLENPRLSVTDCIRAVQREAAQRVGERLGFPDIFAPSGRVGIDKKGVEIININPLKEDGSSTPLNFINNGSWYPIKP